MNNEDLKKQLKQEIRQEMKQERKKKRIIIFIILLVIAGVIAIVVHNYYKKAEQSEFLSNAKTISQEEFSQYITELPPITTDNWSEYFTLEYETIENKNAFGEITSTVKQPYLKLKENIFGYIILQLNVNKNLMTEYMYKEQGQTFTISSKSTDFYLMGIKENITLTINDIICTKAKGKLYMIKNLPADVWQLSNKGEKYIDFENRGIIFENEFIDSLCMEVKQKIENAEN